MIEHLESPAKIIEYFSEERVNSLLQGLNLDLNEKHDRLNAPKESKFAGVVVFQDVHGCKKEGDYHFFLEYVQVYNKEAKCWQILIMDAYVYTADEGVTPDVVLDSMSELKKISLNGPKLTESTFESIGTVIKFKL